WRLSGGRYTPIKADARGWVWSNELGLWLGVVEHDFPKFRAKTPRFFDKAGKLVPMATEAEAENRRNAEERAMNAEEQAEAETKNRRNAEERAEAEAENRRNAEERAEAEAENRRNAEKRAKAEAENRRNAEERAEAEAENRRNAEAEIARLKALLADKQP
ncbi:MAG: Uma2 family endonuclease, partial [Gammaproteobacteria bacterium]|nr:Uma2 family endonuclease [Gammaproteobacteria bacterium]